MTITGGSSLDKEDIDRMMREAEEHADEDKKRREEVDVRNNADSLVYQTEKFIADNDDKLPEDAKANVTGPLDELKKALEGDDIEAIKSATDKVAEASSALGTAMYEAAAQAGSEADAAAAGEGAGDDGDDDVVDAEIVEDDNDESNEAK